VNRTTKLPLKTAGEPATIEPTREVPVFLIEDNRLLRDGLSALLGAQGLNVVATARNGREAMQDVARLKPPLILLDAALVPDSTQFVHEVRQTFPEVKLVLMGLLEAHDHFIEFIKAGAAGFIMKDATIEVFVATIRAVANGLSVLPEALANALFAHVASNVRRRGGRGARPEALMTARERQVIQAIAEGQSNKEIAARLNIATYTVKSHVHNILEKLALHSRLEIAAYAHEHDGAWAVAV
jgi:DNA-binding NarL/FixJ family response regulator